MTGAKPDGAGLGGAESSGVEPGGAGLGGAESSGVEPGGAKSIGARPGGGGDAPPTGRRPRLNVKPAGSGLLLVDKPAGMTSHDVVSRLRRLAGTRRVGHGGTLDPMATGLLVIGVNGGTKLLQYVTGLPKTYLATIRLGIATNTDDAEGVFTAAVGTSILEPELLQKGALDHHLNKYRGKIRQVPTTVSAIRVGGKRAYALAREGQDVQLAPRPVEVHRFEIVGETRQLTLPDGTQVVDFDAEVECSSGTYIRALARDIGEDFGVGGHLTSLRRTTTGPWAVQEALTLPELTEVGEGGGPLDVLTMTEACRALFSEILISETSAQRFRHGAAPVRKDVLEMKENAHANPKFSDVYAVWAKGRPAMVLGLVRVEQSATLETKTATVFPEGL